MDNYIPSKCYQKERRYGILLQTKHKRAREVLTKGSHQEGTTVGNKHHLEIQEELVNVYHGWRLEFISLKWVGVSQ